MNENMKWYTIQVRSSFENKVMNEIPLKLKAAGLTEDLEEIFKIADRVGVMAEGKIQGEFHIDEVEIDEIGALMSGGKEAI